MGIILEWKMTFELFSVSQPNEYKLFWMIDYFSAAEMYSIPTPSLRGWLQEGDVQAQKAQA